MRYVELAVVLKENEGILDAIYRHARGGPNPKIIGMSKEAAALLGTVKGRATSAEFLRATYDQRQALKVVRDLEISRGKKRPEEQLRQHVSATSTLIAAYVSRFQWMAEHAN